MTTDLRTVERFKWRSRRGLLELDLVFQRFWKDAGDVDVQAMERLLALPDNDLLDLVMGRTETDDGQLRELVVKLRAA